MRGASCDAQQGLRRSLYYDQAAIVSHQHIATAHHMTALQKNRQHTAIGIFGLKTTFLPNIPIQRHRRGAFDQCLRKALATRN